VYNGLTETIQHDFTGLQLILQGCFSPTNALQEQQVDIHAKIRMVPEVVTNAPRNETIIRTGIRLTG
jgi:hypothetical protein